jgi:hypothetical protein
MYILTIDLMTDYDKRRPDLSSERAPHIDRTVTLKKNN